MTVGLRNGESTLAAIEGLAGAGLPADELITEASRRIDAVVPSDGFFIVVAISLAAYGLIIAGAIKLGSWTR
mgnify:CR=1 FL=1